MKVQPNDLALGPALPDWTVRPRPPHEAIDGRLVRLEPFDPARHADALHEAYAADRDGAMWTYLAAGPFADAAAYRAHAESAMTGADPLFFAIVDRLLGRPTGAAALMRIDPANGVVEIGSLAFSPALQRKAAATEALILFARLVFDRLGYRRYEWKCNDLNLPSKRAALRLGFRYEGLFRNHMVVKGHSRDTAWFSITDADWPAVRKAYDAWLDPGNFDGEGNQKVSLSSLTALGL